MKLKLMALTAIFAALGPNLSYAANPDHCIWNVGGFGGLTRFWRIAAPSQISLQSAPIGGVMATSPEATLHDETSQITCPYPDVQNYRGNYYVSNGKLADGFADVYETSIPGVGVRIVAKFNNLTDTIPILYEYPNNNRVFMSVIKKVHVEFIRTARFVGQGSTPLNLTIKQDINSFHAAELKILGTTNLESRSYFSGCAGVDKLNIPLGQVSIADIGKRQKQFNLDVLCSGMPPGTKVPVQVYFEGNSNGPGRLNLDAGGAQGVEIELKDDRGALLPFSKGGALSMDWSNSRPDGEVYRLPVSAGYVLKGAQLVKAGKANATLNYIIEYQ